jgi:hypothetical protein
MHRPLIVDDLGTVNQRARNPDVRLRHMREYARSWFEQVAFLAAECASPGMLRCESRS